MHVQAAVGVGAVLDNDAVVCVEHVAAPGGEEGARNGHKVLGHDARRELAQAHLGALDVHRVWPRVVEARGLEAVGLGKQAARKVALEERELDNVAVAVPNDKVDNQAARQ